METFGLFHFLQNLLSQNGNSTPISPQNQGGNEQKTEPIMKAEEVNNPTSVHSENSRSQEAAIQFLYRHETDAKRRKNR